jgi:hypothetical protein
LKEDDVNYGIHANSPEPCWRVQRVTYAVLLALATSACGSLVIDERGAGSSAAASSLTGGPGGASSTTYSITKADGPSGKRELA